MLMLQCLQHITQVTLKGDDMPVLPASKWPKRSTAAGLNKIKSNVEKQLMSDI